MTGKIKAYDQWSARGHQAERLVAQLTKALEPLGDGLDLGFENSIPTVEVALHASDAVMSVRRAIAIGDAIASVISAPVHFFELRSTSVTFFAFSTETLWPGKGTFLERHFEEYGTPLEQWKTGVLSDN